MSQLDSERSPDDFVKLGAEVKIRRILFFILLILFVTVIAIVVLLGVMNQQSIISSSREQQSTLAEFAGRNIELGLATGEMEAVKGLANKLAEHSGRLAGVLALVDDIDCPEVSAENMDSGIKLAEHYALEAIRLFDAGQVDPDLQLAQRVLDWLHSSSWESEFVSVPDLYTYGPNPVRDKKTASRIVRVLEDHRWLHLVADGAVIGGTKRREAWRIRAA